MPSMAPQPARRSRWIAILLLLAFIAQVATAAHETSITLDEPLHIASGYACLLTGDYRLVEEHPPLLKMLQAAPLLLADPPLPDPRTSSGWASADLIAVARETVVAYRPLDLLVYAARVPTMLVGVLLGALVYRWAADLVRRGREGWALLALALFAFDPNMLAHAGVAATDLGAAAGIVAALFTFGRWARSAHSPRLGRALGAAVTLGIALGTKNTALMLGPVAAVLFVRAWPRVRATRYLAQALLIVAGAFLVLWATYRFEVGLVAGVPFPVPAASHAQPLIRLREHMREGHSAFLLGRNYHHGDWRYFPVALALKTPPLTLGLGLLSVVLAAATQRWHRAWSVAGLCIWVLPVLYFATSLVSGINIGYRHLLPVLPFAYVFIVASLSGSVPAPRVVQRVAHAVLLVLLGGYALITLCLHPWHLAYFNTLAGGPDGGYRYLVDSNLDWGQTWKALWAYLDERGITDFYLSSYTINDPHAYGLDYTPLPPWPDAPPVLPQRYNPPPGVYAISSTQLQGVVVADPEMFDAFRRLEPVARIGHAMFVYEVGTSPPIEWVAQCAVPVVPLPAEALREGLGIGVEVSVLSFDCTQSWIVPAGNGRYVLPGTVDHDWALLKQARLAYAQTQTGWVPPYAVYEWCARAPATGPGPQVLVSHPAKVGTVLESVGFTAPELRIGETAVVEVWWRIKARPRGPLSLMAHLVGPDGTAVAVGDGLGVPVDQWMPGGLLIQRHVLAIPAGALPGDYALHLGAYTLPDIIRLPVTDGDSPAADSLVAGVLEVTAP